MMDGACCGPGYASPAEAIKAPREKLLYTIAIYTGTGIQKPDYLATVDADPESATYSQVIHRLEMPGIGDELHHMGWNACSSCHDDAAISRKYLLVPEKRVPVETMYLGEDGLIPLEVKFLHDPDSTHGFCGAALSSNVIHFWKSEAGKWEWEKIIDVENEPHPEWPIPVPGVMSAILVSMDDKYLYLNNWLHGDMRQYDISDPHNPVLTGQVWMGGLLGKAPEVNGVKVAGGPQMYQLSLDGKRLYVTTSLFSTWDNQFYPEIRTQGGVMLMIDCDVENGGMKINEDFVVDFGQEPNGPSRCHETRYPGGDCTSDIWL
ncbi:MAG: hypothetical protein EBY35_06800 [Rhodobacteraceae bacterium]|nr:hypothetical protein [Paracoccaceae bacterium]